MNGPRAETPRPSERPSLDALNRTIEGLETRIAGLLGLGKTAATVAQGRECEGRTEHTGDPLTEIMQRQRSFSVPRARLAPTLDRRMENDNKTRAAAPNAQANLVQNPLAAAIGEISETLQLEFNALRVILAQRASQDSIARLENPMTRFDADAIREEILSLAWRLDDIKVVIGSIQTAPAVTALEDKLVSLARAVESLCLALPDNGYPGEHFSNLDHRLDEISRAIAAISKATAPAQDMTPFNHIEQRIGYLSDRIEALSNQEASLRLEDRIAQLSSMIDRYHDQIYGTDVPGHLALLSAKINGMDQAETTGLMIERLEQLTRRIEDMQIDPVASLWPTDPTRIDNGLAARLETCLMEIAARLDQTIAAPAADSDTVKELERQSASLSGLIHQPRQVGGALAPASKSRISAVEEDLSTKDEYVLEAARQAAETVVEAYLRKGVMQASGASVDIATLADPSVGRRALEEFSRSSDERIFRTFEAMHDTLIQIADRLNDVDSHLVQPNNSATSANALPERAVERPKASEPRYPQPHLMPDRFSVLCEAANQDIEAAHGNPTARGDDQPSKNLLANLGRKFLSSGKETTAKIGHPLIRPLPSLNSPDLTPAADTEELIEPGSGPPDLRRIIAKMGAAPATSKPMDSDRLDIIAAARRATEVAAAEADAG